MMALPDPNKQTFPIIQNPTQFFVSPMCPSPTKIMDSTVLSMKHSSIQLPALVHSGEGDNSSKDTIAQQNATTMSLPKVKTTFSMRKTVPSEQRSNKMPDNFIKVDEPMPYQCQSFRSTTKVKEVQVTKRHRDMFSADARAKPGPPAKTKNMSFYTKPFLWQAQPKTSAQVEMKSLPSRFLQEEENLREVRGQKRKYVVPSHRQGYNDLFVGGNISQIAPKFDYKTEADKLRYMVLPEHAQELYMGRGIKLPEGHSTNRRREDWKTKIDAEYTLPNSAPAANAEPSTTTTTTTAADPTPADTTPVAKPEAQTTKSRYTTSHPPLKVTRSHSISQHDSDTRSSIASERSGASRKPERRKSQTEGTRRNSQVSRRGSNVGRGQKEKMKHEEKVVDSQPPNPDEADLAVDEEEDMEREEAADDSTAIEVQTILEENKEVEETAEVLTEETRPDSEMELEAQEEDLSRPSLHQGTSSIKRASPNPLTTIDVTLHISASQKEELSERFNKLDSNKDGHITFQELTSVLPEALTKSQKKFIKEVYEAVSSSTFFGLEEFVGVTCLGETMIKLPGPVKDMYDAINFATVQQFIMQFVMMFSSVDRQQTGTISIASLLEVLSMATDKDLISDQNQIGQILTTIGKGLNSSIDKVDFLAFLPYFLQLR